MSRSGDLTKQELEKIKAYRYKTNGLTPLEIYVFEHFWNFLANKCLPDWLAPNALTLIGLLFPLLSLITICVIDPTLTQTLPGWVFLLAWFADFWYQTIDAIDGKQARRTDNCSPLGQILDHNLDQITFTCMMVHVCSSLQLGNNMTRILLLTPGVMSAHYSVEYRTHFTGMHQTVIGFMGATEQALAIQGPTLACFFLAESNGYFQWKILVPGFGWEILIADLVIFFAFSTGLHYNLENIIVGFIQAKDKKYALGCLIPYVQFFAMMYTSTFSQLHQKYPVYFIILCGFYLTWVTAIFNLNSTSGAKYNWVFLEPTIYFAIVYLDYNKFLDRKAVAYCYLGFFAVTMIRYLMLMHNIVHQITKHMNLHFLKVKPLKGNQAKQK